MTYRRFGNRPGRSYGTILKIPCPAFLAAVAAETDDGVIMPTNMTSSSPFLKPSNLLRRIAFCPFFRPVISRFIDVGRIEVKRRPQIIDHTITQFWTRCCVALLVEKRMSRRTGNSGRPAALPVGPPGNVEHIIRLTTIRTPTRPSKARISSCPLRPASYAKCAVPGARSPWCR